MGGPDLDDYEVKVLALGGSGSMGQTAVKTLLHGNVVDSMIVADYDIERTDKFVQSLNDERVTSRQIDVRDTQALEELMGEVDLVIYTVGPFYVFGEGIVRTAIKANRHYIDINDDWEPTQKVLELDEEARNAEITVLIGMGASPGITNILARYAADQLDEVENVQTVWGHVGGVLRPASKIVKRSKRGIEQRVEAAYDHFLHNAAVKIPIFRGGKFIEVTPLEDGEDVTFPNGSGKFYYFGHAEPLTLPRFIGKGIKGACNLVGLEPEELDAVRELADKIRSGEITSAEAAAKYPALVYAKKQQRKEIIDSGPRVGGLHASASGKKGGRKVKYGYGCTGEPSGGMAAVTSIPLAIGARMIIEGEIDRLGVSAPEACVDPILFFQRYMEYWDNPPVDVQQALYEVIEEL